MMDGDSIGKSDKVDLLENVPFPITRLLFDKRNSGRIDRSV